LKLKKTFVAIWLLLLVGIVGAIFWYNEIQYQLPTPIPEGYHAIKHGAQINIPATLATKTGKPLFLHFFNPDCPCSRFNIRQFKALVERYGNQVDFKIVAVTRRNYTADDIRKKFDLAIPVTFDQGLAALCGVYSTPQVALLDAGWHLYYRGNYNRSRYCTDERTSYARMAIEGALQKNNGLQFNKYALVSYGCSLPGCKK